MKAIIDPITHSFIDTLVIDKDESFSFELVFVKGGTFSMGSEDEEADEDEKPVHEVNVSDFYLGKYLVSQGFWHRVMGNQPSYFKGKDRPVEQVSWDDCQEFLEKLNGRTDLSYRLPSEAEWEYAARGGGYSKGAQYAGSPVLDEVGWYDNNSSRQTHPLGLRTCNELGIHDLSGEIDEWCQDEWHDDYNGAPGDSLPWQSGDRPAYRVIRGGGWVFDARNCRVSYRFRVEPRDRGHSLGFRLALSPQSVG